MTDLAVQKSQLRAIMKAHRAALAEAEREHASQRTCDLLSSWLHSRSEAHIGVYLASGVELSLDALLPWLWESVEVAAPRVQLSKGVMHFWRLRSLDETKCGAFGIREPTSLELALPEIVLVPGLAFDARGGRLGTGGGWYDRVLNAIPVKVGVCFEAQRVPLVPCEAHDVRMDWVASEAGVWKCDAPARQEK